MTWREREIDPFQSWQPNATGLFVPPDMKRPRPIGIDLFCGIGGFSLGFIQSGFEIVAGVDYDTACMMTYLANLGSYPVEIVYIEPEDRERADKEARRHYQDAGWIDRKGNWKANGDKLLSPNGRPPFISGSARPPEQPGVGHFFLGDIRKLDGYRMLEILGLQPGEVDVVMGGPPCQGYSMAGKRQMMDPRNSLVFEFVRLVLEIQPKAMCFENVPGILSMVTPEGLPVVDAICRVLDDGGFGAYNTLKRSLLSSAGVGAALRSSKQSKSDDDDPDESDDDEPVAGMRQVSFLEATS